MKLQVMTDVAFRKQTPETSVSLLLANTNGFLNPETCGSIKCSVEVFEIKLY